MDQISNKYDTEEKVVKKITDLFSSSEYTRLLHRSKIVPFMEAIGKSRNEMAHSAFLYWLFSVPELQIATPSPVLALLRLLALASDSQEQMPKEIQHAILVNNLTIEQVTASTENVTKSEYGNGRSDIELRLRYSVDGSAKSMLIVIENKIYHKEGLNQCKKYYEHYSKSEGNQYDTILYVFLSPSSPKELSDQHFIKITYQHILDHVLTPIMEVSQTFSQRTAGYISHFIENITSFRNKKVQLAMDKELQKLLSDFYNNNEDLILAAIEAGAPDEIKDKISKGERNYDSYELSYTANGTPQKRKVNAKSRLAKIFVEIYLESHPNTTFDEMNILLKEVKPNLLSHLQGDKTYPIEGKDDWYIQSGIWGKESKYFNALVKLIEKNGITITTI